MVHAVDHNSDQQEVVVQAGGQSGVNPLEVTLHTLRHDAQNPHCAENPHVAEIPLEPWSFHIPK